MSRRSWIWTALIALAMVFATMSGASAQGDDPGQVEAGQTVYAASCAGCHGDDGTGVAGRGRPLIGIASQGDRATHVASVTDGKGGMPAFGTRLDAGEIDAALSFVRLTFVEEAATEAAPADDLARTGSETPALAVGGLTLMAAGGLMVRAARRARITS